MSENDEIETVGDRIAKDWGLDWGFALQPPDVLFESPPCKAFTATGRLMFRPPPNPFRGKAAETLTRKGFGYRNAELRLTLHESNWRELLQEMQPDGVEQDVYDWAMTAAYEESRSLPPKMPTAVSLRIIELALQDGNARQGEFKAWLCRRSDVPGDRTGFPPREDIEKYAMALVDYLDISVPRPPKPEDKP